MAAVVARRAGKRKLFGAGERADPANERNKLENSVCTSCDIQSVVGLRAKQQWLQAPRRGTYWIFRKQYLSVSRPRRTWCRKPVDVLSWSRAEELENDRDLRTAPAKR